VESILQETSVLIAVTKLQPTERRYKMNEKKKTTKATESKTMPASQGDEERKKLKTLYTLAMEEAASAGDNSFAKRCKEAISRLDYAAIVKTHDNLLQETQAWIANAIITLTILRP